MAPRLRMLLSISHASTPRTTLLSMLSASEVPARNTKVGAHRCVIHLVRNSAAGSAMVMAPSYMAESSDRWLASKAIDAWSMTISTITSPRIQSIVAMRCDGIAAEVATFAGPFDMGQCATRPAARNIAHAASHCSGVGGSTSPSL